MAIRVFLLIAAIFSICGCSLVTGDYDTNLDGSGDTDTDTDSDSDADSDSDSDTDDLTPNITVLVDDSELGNGDDVDFGTVLADGFDGAQSDPVQITIRNDGDGVLQSGDAPWVDGPQAAAFIVDHDLENLYIEPGDHITFPAVFDPVDPGEHAAVFIITSDDPLDGTFNLDFTGYGEDPGAPHVPDGTLTIENTTMTVQLVTWNTATDDEDDDEDLVYQLYFSDAADIATVSEILSYGNPLFADWTADAASGTHTGLAPDTLYYYNVLVRDSNGNMAAYDMGSLRTGSEIFMFATDAMESVTAFGGNHSNGTNLCEATRASSYPTLPSTNVLIFAPSVSTGLLEYPADLGVPSDRPIVSPTWVSISSDWAGLFDGDIDNSLYAAYVFASSSEHYWTGASSAGATLSICTNWSNTSTTSYATAGQAGYSGGSWLNSSSITCYSTLKFLCIAWH